MRRRGQIRRRQTGLLCLLHCRNNLGLRLESGKVSADVLVVDHAELPTDNQAPGQRLVTGRPGSRRAFREGAAIIRDYGAVAIWKFEVLLLGKLATSGYSRSRLPGGPIPSLGFYFP